MKFYVGSLLIAGVVSLLSLGAIIIRFDPFVAHAGVKALFWGSLFIVLGSWGSLLFLYVLKQKFYPSVRRGLLFSLAVLATIGAFRYKFLEGWSLAVIPAIIIIVEILITRYISKSDYIEDYA